MISNTCPIPAAGAAPCQVAFTLRPAGTIIGEWNGATDDFGVVVDGELRLSIEGRQTIFGPGSWYELPAGVPRSMRFDVDTTLVEFRFAPALTAAEPRDG